MAKIGVELTPNDKYLAESTLIIMAHFPQPRTVHIVLAVAAITLVIGIGAPALAASAGGAGASAAPTGVDSCTTITEPGEYVLTTDIKDSTEETCIEIESSDVIFDGTGHTIDGVGNNDTNGVSARGSDNLLTNVTTVGLILTDWEEGIDYGRVDNGNVLNNIVPSGISLSLAENNSVSNNTGSVDLAESDNNTVSNNAPGGVSLFDADDNRIVNNSAIDTQSDGFSLSALSSGNVLRENTARGNDGVGISVGNSFGARLIDNTVTNNDGSGIDVSERTGHTLLRNTVKRNGGGGILFEVGGGTVQNNTVRNNEGRGIVITNLGFSVVSNNVINGNDDDGIELSGPTRENELRANVISANGGAGINFNGGGPSNNTIVNNYVYDDEPISYPNLDENMWNVSQTAGMNILDGSVIGGNYYGSPDTTGYSQTCDDTDNDEICDNPNDFDVNDDNTDFLPLADNGQPAPVAGGRLPSDLNSDRLYEDVNGDGSFDIVDVQALFAGQEKIANRGDGLAFDFNGDGRFDIVDVQRLFVILTE